jgi:hypothetical protein
MSKNNQKRLDEFFTIATIRTSKKDSESIAKPEHVALDEPVSESVKPKHTFVYIQNSRKAVFIDNPEHNDILICQKAGLNLYLRGTINEYTIPQSKQKYNVPFLKSQLQKCIRQCQTTFAIKTAAILIRTDFLELLRRLPIIVLEDSTLFSWYPILVWFMIAHGNYKYSLDDYNLILIMVHQLCNTRDYFYSKKDGSLNEKDISHEIIVDRTSHLGSDSNTCDLLLSIYYRLLYGCMEGDKALLKSAIDYYYSNKALSIENTYGINYKDFEDVILEKHEILMSAIDYHPFPIILKRINSELPNIPVFKIKETIWHCSSCVNIRKRYTYNRISSYNEYWAIIEPVLHKIRDQILEREILAL